MFDNSFPYHNATSGKPSTHQDKGNISLIGSSGSIWNVLPYIDSQERGSIFNKETFNSMVFSVFGGNATKDNPFVVNLTGPEQLQSASLPIPKIICNQLDGARCSSVQLTF